MPWLGGALCVCNADDTMTQGGDFAFDPLAIKARNQGWASDMLVFLGITTLITLVAHAAAAALWLALPMTKHKPLPDFLVFPVPELLLANLLVLPLAMASTVLCMQVGRPGSQVLGSLAMAVLLAYLALVGAVLLGVAARKELIGLRYVQHAAGVVSGQSSSLVEPPLAQQDQQPGKGTADNGARQVDSDAGATKVSSRSSMQALLLRVAPPHASGHWERPDAVLQQDLRRSYQGKQIGSMQLSRKPALCAMPTHRRQFYHLNCSVHTGVLLVVAAGTKRATLRLVSGLVRLRSGSFPLNEGHYVVGWPAASTTAPLLPGCALHCLFQRWTMRQLAIMLHAGRSTGEACHRQGAVGPARGTGGGAKLPPAAGAGAGDPGPLWLPVPGLQRHATCLLHVWSSEAGNVGTAGRAARRLRG